MTIETSTAAQRLTLRDKLAIAATAAQKYGQNARNPTVFGAALFDPLVVAVQAAIAAAGYSASLPATQAVVSNGGTSPVQNSAGAAIGTGTYTVAANAVSNIKLPANVAGVTSGVKVNAGTVTGTGNFATITVANGVITGIVLSAS